MAWRISMASIRAIDVGRHRGRLAVPKRLAREKAGRAVAAKMRDDHPVAADPSSGATSTKL